MNAAMAPVTSIEEGRKCAELGTVEFQPCERCRPTIEAAKRNLRQARQLLEDAERPGLRARDALVAIRILLNEPLDYISLPTLAYKIAEQIAAGLGEK